MRLTPPKKWVFYVAALLAIVGLIGVFVPALGAYSFWLAFLGWLLLAAGNALKGF
ncbi:MAG: hypothetical protein HND51_23575 [Chloroflexi bacterium]|nr:hypothetical protein [Chloroflexota bacterium]